MHLVVFPRPLKQVPHHSVYRAVDQHQHRSSIQQPGKAADIA